MKFVRWLGAFGAGNSLQEAAEWETKQTDRQVAAEPLVRGKSFLTHAKIGLSIAHPEATFARGWLRDAYTVINENGLLQAKRDDSLKMQYKNMDKFLSALSKRGGRHHAEASFNAPIYDAVVVKHNATQHGKKRAQRLATTLNLPLIIL